MPPSVPPSAFTGPIRGVLGLLGAGSFGTGVLAVFRTENGTGAAVLLAFGGLLLVLAVLGSRIESIEFGGAKLKLQAQAAERFAAADEAEREGDLETAGRLRDEAQALLDAGGPIASEYRTVRGSQRAGRARTRDLDRVVSKARALAAERDFEPGEVARWLTEGTDEQRITALAMMQAKPELRDFDAALAVIGHPRSPFEQYHALVLATQMIDHLDDAQRRRLARTVEGARGFRFRRDSDRWQLSELILARVEPKRPS